MLILIRRKVLDNSNNMFVRMFSHEDKYVYVAQKSDLKAYPDVVILREKNSMLWGDYSRDVQFNNLRLKRLPTAKKQILSNKIDNLKQYRTDLGEQIKQGLNADELHQWIQEHRDPVLRAWLDESFPGSVDGISYTDLILQHYTQGPLGPPILSIESWGLESGLSAGQLKDKEDLEADELKNEEIVEAKEHEKEKSRNRQVNIYSCVENGEYKVYLEMKVFQFLIKDINSGREVIMNGGCFHYELRPEGFCYREDKSYAYGLDYYRMLSGEMPHRMDALLSYPLNYRLQDAYYATYHDFLANKTVRNVIGFPIKFVFEFMPRAMAATARFARDYLLENFPDERLIKNPMLRYPAQLLTAATMAVLGVVEGVGEIVHATLSRISSPVKSFKEAWAMHPLLGVLSAMVSVAGTVALGIALSPLLPAVGLGSSLSWLMSHGGVIGQLCVQLGAKISGMLGLSVMSEAVGISVVAAGLYSLVFTPLRSLVQRVMGYEQVPAIKVIEDEPKPQANVASSNQVIKNKLLEAGPTEQESFMQRIEFSDDQEDLVVVNNPKAVLEQPIQDEDNDNDWISVSVAGENQVVDHKGLDQVQEEDPENQFIPQL